MKKLLIKDLPEDPTFIELSDEELSRVDGAGWWQTLKDLLAGKYVCAGCATQGCMSAGD
jgi:hypothetical protein